MRGFALASFIVVLISFYEQGNATRYLPSIVWDHYNPMLGCKCNWFNTDNIKDSLVKVEIYDRFEFVCPTELLNVHLLDKFSRPSAQMNLNLFMRKWKNGTRDLKGLKAAMKSGEFCDREHSETKQLLTCKDGQKGKGETVRFAPDTGYVKDDLVVFFNNGDDGRVTTLPSKEKKCAMAFIVLVTWKDPMRHDFTYGKNLKQLSTDSQCNDLEETCTTSCVSPTSRPSSSPSPPPSPSPSSPTTTTMITTPTPTWTPTMQQITHSSISGNTSTPKSSLSTTTATKTSNITGNNAGVKQSARGGSDKNDWDKFLYGFVVGFVPLLILDIVIVIIYQQSKRTGKTSCGCHYKVGDQCQITIVNNNSGAEKDAQGLPKKPPLPESILDEGNGINNQAYQSNTLKRDRDQIIV